MKLNLEVDKIIKKSSDIAKRFNSSYISSYHFLLAVMECDNLPKQIFENKKLKYKNLQKILNQKTSRKTEKYYLTKELETAIVKSEYFSWIYHQTEIKPEMIIFAMLADKESFAGKFLKVNKIEYLDFKKEYCEIKNLKTRKLFEFIGLNEFGNKYFISKIIPKIQ